jgi:NitT/TauT family transport system ATP-binding protein
MGERAEGSNSDAAIAVRELEKTYEARAGDRVLALDRISLKVQRQEFVSVVGPSGCGKSTLLKIVAGLIAPTRGEVEVNGVPVRGPIPDIGMVFQSPVLLPWKTILHNVLFPIRILRRDMAAHQPAAMALLALAGLAEAAHRYPSELSGGMQQRAALCRALVHDPALLLMDEPFGALDAMTRDDMNVELLRIWSERRKTVLFITHSISEAVFLSDTVVVMTPRPGRVDRVIPIDLPRPRNDRIRDTRHFGELQAQVRERIYAGRPANGGAD